MLSEPDSGYFQARRFGHRNGRRMGLGPCVELCVRHVFDRAPGPGREGLGARDIDDVGLIAVVALPPGLIAVGLWLIAVGIAFALTFALASAFPLRSVLWGPFPPPIPIRRVENLNFGLPGLAHRGERPSIMAFSASDLPRRLRFATGTTIHRNHGVWPFTDMLVPMPIFVPPRIAFTMSHQVFYDDIFKQLFHYLTFVAHSILSHLKGMINDNHR